MRGFVRRLGDGRGRGRSGGDELLGNFRGVETHAALIGNFCASREKDDSRAEDCTSQRGRSDEVSEGECTMGDESFKGEEE
jgi:hypothetical protein